MDWSGLLVSVLAVAALAALAYAPEVQSLAAVTAFALVVFACGAVVGRYS